MAAQNKNKRSKAFPYIERDESWLYFNHRILLEAQRNDVPLLERFNYLGIYSNNLDEYFRVRVASLQHLGIYKKQVSKAERSKARKVLRKIYEILDNYVVEFEDTFHSLVQELDNENVHIVNEHNLLPEQEEEVRDFYFNKLNGSTNPLFLDRLQFSAEKMDEALYLAVDLRQQEEKKLIKSDIALVRVPTEKYGRFIRLKDREGHIYVMFLDDIIRYCMPYIFLGLHYNSYEAYSFKFTKNAEMDMEDDIHSSVLQKVTHGVKSRQHGEMLRLVLDKEMPKRLVQRLIDFADIDKYDAKMMGGRYHNSKDLMHFPDVQRPQYRFAPHTPLPGSSLSMTESIIEVALKQDIGLHFPYCSFDRFLRLLREAAISDEVDEIKVTLYRVAKQSNLVEALMAAAANGKRVTAVIELMARFDEEHNISLSQKLEAAGIRVLFGPEKLKVHAKLVYISTKKGNIACVGTGNMHEGTAKLYTDYMMMTAREEIVKEVDKVFQFIEFPYMTSRFKELLVSPNYMRSGILSLINKEIKNAEAGLPAYIKVKINHITDKRIISRLYAAGRAGVDVQLLVRGNCSLVPQVEGVSPNITQHAIIDRYLEHSRIFIFANGGNPKYFIGSADWMERNLDRRIEVLAPVYDKRLQEELLRIVEWGMEDVAQAHYVNYEERRPLREVLPLPWFRSQDALYQYYQAAEQHLSE